MVSSGFSRDVIFFPQLKPTKTVSNQTPYNPSHDVYPYPKVKTVHCTAIFATRNDVCRWLSSLLSFFRVYFFSLIVDRRSKLYSPGEDTFRQCSDGNVGYIESASCSEEVFGSYSYIYIFRTLQIHPNPLHIVLRDVGKLIFFSHLFFFFSNTKHKLGEFDQKAPRSKNSHRAIIARKRPPFDAEFDFAPNALFRIPTMRPQLVLHRPPHST